MPRHLLAFLFLPVTLVAQPDATIHQEYRYQLPNPKLTWTPVAGLPSGLRLITETAELWGAPNEAGQYTFALQASNGAQLTLNLKVNALWNLSLTPPQATVGVAFSHSQVIGGGTPPYTFSASGLPSGLTISKAGVISGTPTNSGNYSATINVTDHQHNTLTLSYSLSVNALGIATTNLPPADPSKPYSQQLTAAGGTPPYTWSLLDDNSCPDVSQHPAAVSPDFQVPLVANYGGPLPLVGNLTADGILTVPVASSIRRNVLCAGRRHRWQQSEIMAAGGLAGAEPGFPRRQHRLHGWGSVHGRSSPGRDPGVRRR